MEKEKELLIEITNKCPLNCIFCSSNSNIRKNTFISKKILKQIISDAKIAGINVIQLSGGEPFQHPHIYEIIDFILKKNFKLVIYTCGNIYLNRKYQSIPTKFFKKYKNNPNITLRYNFQTIDKKIFEVLTNNKFALNNLIASIRTSTENGIKIEVHIIPTNLNVSNLEETIDFLLNNLGVTHIKLLRLIFHGRAEENWDLLTFDKNVLYNTIFRLKQKYDNSKVEIGTAFSILSNSCIDCQAGFNKYMITADLKLFPCTAFKNRTKCYVQIDESNTFRKIISLRLLNRKLQKLNERLDCSYCLIRNKCAEICPVQKMICKDPIMLDIIENPIVQSKATQ